MPQEDLWSWLVGKDCVEEIQGEKTMEPEERQKKKIEKKF